MRFICFLTLVLCAQITIGQEVKPGSTVINQLNSTGTTQVDYTTGILNYNVPLLTVEQDGFTLPISLNYNARGVRADEKMGLAGLGWALSTGGVSLNRILRGASADEDLERGIFNHPIPTNPALLPAHIEEVNSNKIDGESDLFVLSVGGETVKFILKKEGAVFVPKPLEKTNVLIKCTVYGDKIDQWEVRDAAGNYYEFVASLPGMVFIQNTTPNSSLSTTPNMNWYITKIKLFNNDEIKFLYSTQEYVELTQMPMRTMIHYGIPLRLPKVYDENSQSQLSGLFSMYPNYASQIGVIQTNISNLQANLSYEDWRYDRFDAMSPDPSRFRNSPLISYYEAALKYEYRQLSAVNTESSTLGSTISNMLSDMFYNIIERSDGMAYSGNGGIFANRLLSKIVFRDGEVNFSYKNSRAANWDDMYSFSKIEYKNLAGDVLCAVELNVNDYGYLKDVQWVNNKNDADRIINFDYYNEDIWMSSGLTALDYWGYYNGKWDNIDLVPNDPSFYHYDQAGRFCSVFNLGGGSLGKSDRKPVEGLAKARSLQTIRTQTGKTVTLDYESNKVYSGDYYDNILMGGIRVKSVAVSDGITTNTTSYKYEFPSATDPSKLISTGRLNEWQKKAFGWNYLYSGNKYDTYTYSDMKYLGTLVDDNSNNGVLYHYVEEIRPDGSAIGFKYPEIFPKTYNIENLQHNPQLDKALLATIYYNKDGHIAKVVKRKYKYPASMLGTRKYEQQNLLSLSSSYFTDAESITPGFIPQIKKEQEHYNNADLLKAYPDSDNSGFHMTFNSWTYTLNLRRSVYAPNYSFRVNHVSEEKQYGIPVESALLLGEEESFEFGDYDLAAAAVDPSWIDLPNEKPYLFERLIRYTAAPRIRNSTSYSYNSVDPFYPNIIKTTDSKNNIFIRKNKFVSEYQLPATDEISLLQQSNALNSVVETQQWQSTDNGSTFKLVNSEMTKFEKLVKDGNTYIVPGKKYLINSSRLLDLPTLGYTEKYSNMAPYTTLFWDNMDLFKQEQTNNWKRYNYFTRLVQTEDKASKNMVKYNEYTGAKIMEATDVDFDNIVAAEFASLQTHSYYASKYDLFAKRPRQLHINPAMTFDYLNAMSISDLYSNYYIIDINTFDHVKFATDACNKMREFEMTNQPLVYNYPFYWQIKYFFEALKNKFSLEDFNDQLMAVQNGHVAYASQYGNLSVLLYEHGLNLEAMWIYIDKLSLAIKTNYSSVYGAYDVSQVNTKIYEARSLVDFNSWITPKIMNMTVTPAMVQNRYYNIYCVYETSGSVSVDVKAVYADGTLSANKSLAFNNKRISTLQLDIQTFPNYSNIKGFQFTLYGSAGLEQTLRYFAAVPAGKAFKAYVYLPNGQPYLQFDQNADYQELVYDSFGRVDHKKNKNGEVIEKQEIKFAKPDLTATKLVDVVILNGYHIEERTAPKIKKLTFTDVNGRLRSTDFTLNMFPSEAKTIQIPAGVYDLTMTTDWEYNKIVINDVTTPISLGTNTGINNYRIDMTNGKTVKIQFLNQYRN